ncbi:MAG: DUF362 domain-containing protein [Phycisphaerae bacterium]|nr:DUF362 domain-containing protein [Phycisphaerae bacterium]
MNRREFFTAAGSAGLLAAGGCAKRAAIPRTTGRVFIGAADDYDRDLVQVLSAGLAEFPRLRVAGRRVLLKPNLVETTDADRPVNTHPAVIVAAAEAFRRAGAASIIVGDGPGHRRDIELVLAQSGLGRALREAKLPFVDLNHDAVVAVRNLGDRTGLDALYLPRAVVSADLVVSIGKLKTHHWAGVTLSMKNCFGLMPGLVYGWPKNVLHWRGIENSIVDIVATVRPSFGIIDGIVGMEGDGPIMGTRKHVGVLAMSDEPASLDATCAALMGMRPERIAYIRDLAGMGFGACDPARIEPRGESPRRFATRFAVLPQFRHLLA